MASKAEGALIPPACYRSRRRAATEPGRLPSSLGTCFAWWTAMDLAAPVVTLLIVYVNLLLAGHALASRSEGVRPSFALGPLGVAGVAIGGTLFGILPVPQSVTAAVAGVSAHLALLGFAGDAARLAGPRRWWWVAWSAVALGAALGLLLIPSFVSETFSVGRGALALRTSPFALLVFIFLVHADQARRDPSERLSRLAAFVIATGVAASVIFGLAQGLSGVWLVADPLLVIALCAEGLVWAYVREQRVTVRLFASRAVVWLVLGVGGIVVATALSRRLGLHLDTPRILLVVSVTLLVGLSFIIAAEVLSRRLEGLLFPQRQRLERQLELARAEATSVKSRLVQVERLALAGELATSVAHEIKNPLAAVRGYAELLEPLGRDVPVEHRARFEKGLRVILEESERIDARVHELLALARPRDGQPRASVPFSLQQLASEALAVVESEAVGATLELVSGADCTAQGDADAIRGALVNLVRNAVEAQAGQGAARVELVLSAAPGLAAIEVRDRGPGLPPEVEANPFVPFRTSKAQGTGLGLVIARAAVEASGGTLVLSRGANGGTCARIALPAHGG
jgi:signal transduction histidine kinase